jgi:hypothetical protein
MVAVVSSNLPLVPVMVHSPPGVQRLTPWRPEALILHSGNRRRGWGFETDDHPPGLKPHALRYTWCRTCAELFVLHLVPCVYRMRAADAPPTPDKCDAIDGTTDAQWKRRFEWTPRLYELNQKYFGNRGFRCVVWEASQGMQAGWDGVNCCR